jgi:hypothetical protein
VGNANTNFLIIKKKNCKLRGGTSAWCSGQVITKTNSRLYFLLGLLLSGHLTNYHCCRHEISSFFQGITVLLPLIHVPAVTPEGALISTLDGLSEEHI